jgi:undecaprenyl-phosphate 4-deoxy-4-formamido-L-arabinose transferase
MSERYALSIVVPVYNGAHSVGPLVEAVAALKVQGGHEIVLVVDGSPDNSLEVCRSLIGKVPAPVTVVDLARNFGEHNAVMAGLAHARGSYVITMDDDLQNPPEEVVRLFEHTRDGDFDVVYTYYAKKEHAAWRNLGSRFANWCADQVLDKPKGLYLCSFRCMSAFVVKQVLRYTGPYPYVDGLLMQSTKRIGTLLVHHLPRAEGRTNYTMRRLVRLWLAMLLNFSVMPLRLATMFGLVMSGIGILGFLAVLAEAARGETPPGWASIMASSLLLGGVQFVMLGVVGEYVGRLFLTVNGKPQSIVRTVDRDPKVAGAAPSGPASVEPLPAYAVAND